MRILVIEDEFKVAEAIRSGLALEGYQVKTAHSGEDGYFLATSESFDLILLDLMLPGRDGIEILKTLRDKHNEIPVLILTAKDTTEDKVLGLDSGADDYLIKPFAFPELLARIRAISRRGRPDQVLKMKLDDLELDCVTRMVTRKGREILLTGMEFKLLEYLMSNQGHIVSREMLAHDVWNVSERATPLDNVIDVHINHLREKMDKEFRTKLLHTIRGVGFIMKSGDDS